MERVCVFIDGSNFYHGLKEDCGRTNIDFVAFVNWLVGSRHYTAVARGSAITDIEKAKGQQRFLAGLGKLRYFDVRLGRLEPRGGTFVEKGVDVAIAIDMLSLAVTGVYDVAVLVSSDGDFEKAVRAVQETGRHVEVACFKRAHRLKQAADIVVDLNSSTLSALWYKPKAPPAK